ncbi:MAG: hypothetical protein C4521_13185 [Actinobacteria bacterium]|nr:MAG: hypothetical protein C4521_13185 [Actinomycetota bacterium]
MRLWSLHPRYLDRARLVALWREGLLAQAVLAGSTKGYTKHPQLERFRAQPDPLSAVASYLEAVWREADRRGYRFDRGKIMRSPSARTISVTRGQLRYEMELLCGKIGSRDPAACEAARGRAGDVEPHPLFEVVPGEAERWERRSAGLPGPPGESSGQEEE